MPRALSGGLTTHIAGSMLTLTTYVRLQRLDGTVMGFTSLDQDITFGGVTYEHLSSANASSVRASEGAGVDNLDIVGLVTSSRIKDVEILAGLYDGAAVEIGMVNYLSLGDGTIILLTGIIGEISEREGEYTAEIRGLSQRLGQQIGALTAPLCRVRQFGDSECAPPGDPITATIPSAYQATRTVSVVTSATQMTFAADASLTSYYRYGRVQFSTGANSGIQREIKSHTLSAGTAQIVLQEAFPFVVQVGDTALLEAGCDRTLARCQFFSNVQNMAAEPYLPGNLLILRRGRR